MHGRCKQPKDLDPKDCLGYAYPARNDVWRLTNRKGKEEIIVPEGRLRVTNSDAPVPATLSGLAVSELPEFIAAEYIRDGCMEAILTDWSTAQGGLYCVTSSSRTRPAKVEVLAGFFVERLSSPQWLGA